jgi:hypothetical protein
MFMGESYQFFNVVHIAWDGYSQGHFAISRSISGIQNPHGFIEIQIPFQVLSQLL